MRVVFIKFLDKYIGAPIILLLSLFKRKRQVKVKKVICIQLWGVGETILTLPSISRLKDKYLTVDVLCTKRNRDVYLCFKKIDNVRVIDLNPFSIISFAFANFNKYDLVVDYEEYLNISSILSFFIGRESWGFSSRTRSRLYDKNVVYNDEQHTAQTFLELIGETKLANLIKLEVDEKDKKVVENFLNAFRGKKIIGLVAGGAESSKARQWPYYDKLADSLIEKYNAHIIFIGANYDVDIIDKIITGMKHKDSAWNMAGKLSLTQTFYLIEMLDMVISNDTGPMHIAAAQGVKTIGLFGPNIPTRWAPLGKGNISLYHKVECSPCINTHLGIIPECKFQGKDYQKCMKKISVEEVMQKVGWSI